MSRLRPNFRTAFRAGSRARSSFRPSGEKEWEEYDNEIADLMINGPISNDFLPGEWPTDEEER